MMLFCEGLVECATEDHALMIALENASEVG